LSRRAEIRTGAAADATVNYHGRRIAWQLTHTLATRGLRPGLTVRLWAGPRQPAQQLLTSEASLLFWHVAAGDFGRALSLVNIQWERL